MSEWKYTNPRHYCLALKVDNILPAVAKMKNGELVNWGYMCPFCKLGRKFTDEEKKSYETYEAVDN